LESDGLGGFASGTASGIRTRRYHALLLAATTPPAGRFVLVNGLEAWLETPAGRIPLSSQRYAPDVVHPDGTRRIDRFDADPWRPYEGLPSIHAAANGAYTHDPVWYRRFQYDEERARGLDFVEDLAAPGIFRFDLGVREAALVLGTVPTPDAAEDLRQARAVE